MSSSLDRVLFEFIIACLPQQLKALNLTDIAAKISQEKSTVDQLDVPHAQRNVRSPHRPSDASQELPDTVNNFVDFVKEGNVRHRYRHNMHTRYRGLHHSSTFSSIYYSNWNFIVFFCLLKLVKGSWSTSSSPVRTPSPSCQHIQGPYGTTSLQQRSRSPSPSKSRDTHFRGSLQLLYNNILRTHLSNDSCLFSDYQQNYQLLNLRRGRGRILPATPNKPSDMDFHVFNSNPRVSVFYLNIILFQ